MSTQLYDSHSSTFRAAFESALKFNEYIAQGSVIERSRWEAGLNACAPTPAQKQLIGAFRRHQNILVLSGRWCGDCARSGPMLESIARCSSMLDLRFVESGTNKALGDELRIHGAQRVPVVLHLSEDFFEVARYGDRTLSVYRRKASSELGPACEIAVPQGEALSLELNDWVENFERAELLLRLSGLLRSRYND